MLTDAQTVVGFLVETFTLLGILGGGMVAALRWIWKKVRLRLVEPLEALATEVRGDIKHLKDEVGTVKSQVGVIQHEVTPNHGGSIKDAVKRLEESSDRQERGQVSLSHDIEKARVERMQQIDALDRRLDDHIDRHRS